VSQTGSAEEVGAFCAFEEMMNRVLWL